MLVAIAAMFLSTLSAQAQNAKILHVEQRVKRGYNHPPAQRFFMDYLPQHQAQRTVRDQEVFYVHWVPQPGATVPRPKLIFEYRQERGAVRALQIAYPFNVTDRRKATFTVNGDTLKAGGAVTAWRTRLMSENGLLISEKRSDSWNK